DRAVLQARGGAGRPLSAVRPVGRRPPAPRSDVPDGGRPGTEPGRDGTAAGESRRASIRSRAHATRFAKNPSARVTARKGSRRPRSLGQPLRDTASFRSVVAEGRGQPEGRVAPIRSPLWMLAMRTRPPV